MKKLIAVAALALVPAVPALAAEAAPAAAPAAKAAFSTAETTIGDLLDNAATKAVLEKHIPAMVSSPQIDMARGMTLKQVQGFASDMLTDDVLAKIDADLAAVPAAK